ncbi:unnamed protein product, partial [Didymodactylos carnosus]
ETNLFTNVIHLNITLKDCTEFVLLFERNRLPYLEYLNILFQFNAIEENSYNIYNRDIILLNENDFKRIAKYFSSTLKYLKLKNILFQNIRLLLTQLPLKFVEKLDLYHIYTWCDNDRDVFDGIQWESLLNTNLPKLSKLNFSIYHYDYSIKEESKDVIILSTMQTFRTLYWIEHNWLVDYSTDAERKLFVIYIARRNKQEFKNVNLFSHKTLIVNQHKIKWWWQSPTLSLSSLTDTVKIFSSNLKVLNIDCSMFEPPRTIVIMQ